MGACVSSANKTRIISVNTLTPEERVIYEKQFDVCFNHHRAYVYNFCERRILAEIEKKSQDPQYTYSWDAPNYNVEEHLKKIIGEIFVYKFDSNRKKCLTVVTNPRWEDNLNNDHWVRKDDYGRRICEGCGRIYENCSCYSSRV